MHEEEVDGGIRVIALDASDTSMLVLPCVPDTKSRSSIVSSTVSALCSFLWQASNRNGPLPDITVLCAAIKNYNLKASKARRRTVD